MPKTLSNPTKTEEKDTPTQLPTPARLIGPEDVAVGQFVTIAEFTREVVWLDSTSFGDDQSAIRKAKVTTLSGRAGEPLRVLAVTLPYVFVVDVDGDHSAVDLRRERLALLSNAYGKAAFKAVQKAVQKAAQKAKATRRK